MRVFTAYFYVVKVMVLRQFSLGYAVYKSDNFVLEKGTCDNLPEKWPVRATSFSAPKQGKSPWERSCSAGPKQFNLRLDLEQGSLPGWDSGPITGKEATE